jgi:hypothetical protein
MVIRVVVIRGKVLGSQVLGSLVGMLMVGILRGRFLGGAHQGRMVEVQDQADQEPEDQELQVLLMVIILLIVPIIVPIVITLLMVTILVTLFVIPSTLWRLLVGIIEIVLGIIEIALGIIETTGTAEVIIIGTATTAATTLKTIGIAAVIVRVIVMSSCNSVAMIFNYMMTWMGMISMAVMAVMVITTKIIMIIRFWVTKVGGKKVKKVNNPVRKNHSSLIRIRIINGERERERKKGERVCSVGGWEVGIVISIRVVTTRVVTGEETARLQVGVQVLLVVVVVVKVVVLL